MLPIAFAVAECRHGQRIVIRRINVDKQNQAPARSRPCKVVHLAAAEGTGPRRTERVSAGSAMALILRKAPPRLATRQAKARPVDGALPNRPMPNPPPPLNPARCVATTAAPLAAAILAPIRVTQFALV